MRNEHVGRVRRRRRNPPRGDERLRDLERRGRAGDQDAWWQYQALRRSMGQPIPRLERQWIGAVGFSTVYLVTPVLGVVAMPLREALREPRAALAWTWAVQAVRLDPEANREGGHDWLFGAVLMYAEDETLATRRAENESERIVTGVLHGLGIRPLPESMTQGVHGVGGYWRDWMRVNPPSGDERMRDLERRAAHDPEAAAALARERARHGIPDNTVYEPATPEELRAVLEYQISRRGVSDAARRQALRDTVDLASEQAYRAAQSGWSFGVRPAIARPTNGAAWAGWGTYAIVYANQDRLGLSFWDVDASGRPPHHWNTPEHGRWDDLRRYQIQTTADVNGKLGQQLWAEQVGQRAGERHEERLRERRGNPPSGDQRLRALERRAAQGDPQAQAELQSAQDRLAPRCVTCGGVATHLWGADGDEPRCMPCIVSGMEYGHRHAHDYPDDCHATAARLSGIGVDHVACPQGVVEYETCPGCGVELHADARHDTTCPNRPR